MVFTSGTPETQKYLTRTSMTYFPIMIHNFVDSNEVVFPFGGPSLMTKIDCPYRNVYQVNVVLTLFLKLNRGAAKVCGFVLCLIERIACMRSQRIFFLSHKVNHKFIKFQLNLFKIMLVFVVVIIIIVHC